MPVQYFVFSTTRIYLLFRPWYIITAWQYALSFIGVFVAALLFEYLKTVQARLSRWEQESIRSSSSLHHNNGETCSLLSASGGINSATESRFALSALATTPQHCCDMSLALRLAKAIMHGVQIAFSYFLMLVVMTFNAGLFLAIIAGATVGYFRFTAIKQHCPPGLHVDSTLPEEEQQASSDTSGAACH